MEGHKEDTRILRWKHEEINIDLFGTRDTMPPIGVLVGVLVGRWTDGTKFTATIIGLSNLTSEGQGELMSAKLSLRALLAFSSR